MYEHYYYYKELIIIPTLGLCQKFSGFGIILIPFLPNNPEFNPDFWET